MYKIVVVLAMLFTLASRVEGQSLKGSPASVARMYSVAQKENFTFLSSAKQVKNFVKAGRLVYLSGNGNYKVASSVSFPYVRPEVKLFAERLSAQHRSACGREIVVTGATRPTTARLANSSDLSVHPTGMALDLRVSRNAACRSWLKSTLLKLERAGVLEATKERWPPHYHVAVFPTAYRKYVAGKTRNRAR